MAGTLKGNPFFVRALVGRWIRTVFWYKNDEHVNEGIP